MKRNIIEEQVSLGEALVDGMQLGIKHDQDKNMMNLIPPSAIESLGQVLTYGANKYAPNSWQHVSNAEERYKAALLRHFVEYMKNPLSKDEESDMYHIEHVLCNAAFLNDFVMNKNSDIWEPKEETKVTQNIHRPEKIKCVGCGGDYSDYHVCTNGYVCLTCGVRHSGDHVCDVDKIELDDNDVIDSHILDYPFLYPEVDEDDEYTSKILVDYVNKGCFWFARHKNGEVWFFTTKPYKNGKINQWCSDDGLGELLYSLSPDDDYLEDVLWTDMEPEDINMYHWVNYGSEIVPHKQWLKLRGVKDKNHEMDT